MLAFLIIFSLLMLFYTYFGYPLILALFSYLIPRKPTSEVPLDSSAAISIVISAYNEEKVIGEKVEQTLELSYGETTVRQALLLENRKIQLLVASDASTDRTHAIVDKFKNAGVELLILPQRGGKEMAQRAAIKQARGEILLFTDAKIKLNQDALNCLPKYFSDPGVGAVSSIDRVVSRGNKSSGEGFYVKYEMWLRSLESAVFSLVGLSGSCFAVRREVCDNFASDIPSDFALLLEARRRGLRGVQADDIIGSYQAVKTEEEEFSRKVRTVLRGMSALFAHREIMNPFQYASFAWQIISHKICRWLVPWFFILACLGSFALAASSAFFAFLALLLGAFCCLAAAAYLLPEKRSQLFFKIPLFFIVSNAAIALAWIKYLSGKRAVTWSPSQKL